ncbi:glycosyltransferase family protein [Microbacterium amylolyticum]|uniref:Spore protein YkvP/CgeB glycosyl transferase-like domain-containing protein n=1 Tax=Microbacterium amylolyticum TaxID=936337 RepID=A0ABS4ZIF3_9MICO|nr:glycosyltransferase [Microbacterium amylolyticum]MBP2437059.1 hypothetical protein [Microbacterium amylolyticum]
MTSDAIFISWIRHHGRSAGLADALGIDSFYVTGGSGPAPLRYLRAWRETARILRDCKPNSVVVMQPPVVALLSVAMSAPRSTQIIGDLHTGVFTDPKWKWALGLTMRILRKRGAAVVTGADLAQRTREYGVEALEMHDMITSVAVSDESPDDPGLVDVIKNDFALVPLAYAFDEPVDEILQAARDYPDVTWVLTGRPPHAVRDAAPDNVVFPGFVTNEDYGRLVANATVMVAVTTQENTMQRVGYEAIGSGVALVTSGTKVLRDFFGDAALYIEPTSASIGAQVNEAIADAKALAARIVTRRASIVAQQAAQLEHLGGVIRKDT